MKIIRITKQFKMEMAHALYGYDGLCKNIHGHSYRLWVTLRGPVLDEPGHEKDGMVLDFGLLKRLVKPHIIDKYDHSFVLNANSSHANIDLSAFEKVYLLPYQPTSENLVNDFVSIIKNQLPENIELYKVVLSETANSFAEWCLDDNP
ncbi:MAG: 6-pyruvoyl trahydropterin synthase family protein [Flavobacteriales bacterium]|nr:6-carboxytetrahydropterin synthase [Flavobacteriales bacterium]